jgi:hypothetical protein
MEGETMKTHDNCSKRHTHRCEEYKQNRRYPDDGGWCAGWKKKPVDNLTLIGTLVDRINEQTAIINRRQG